MKNVVFITQGVFQILVGIGAVVCGAMFMAVPSGALLQMSVDMLKETPFDDFFVPGIILFLVNGIGQAVGGVLTMRRHRFAGYLGAALGIGLMIWIFVQVNMIGGRNILQYSYFIVGACETGLAFLIQNYLTTQADKK